MLRRTLIASVTPLVLLVASVGSAEQAAAPADRHAHEHDAGPSAAELRVPASLQAEHRHLHEQLASAIRGGGKTAIAAQQVERLLAAHFKKEEQHAMKPLALLAPLARGEKIDPAIAQQAIADTDFLRRDYDTMLQEHREIGKALDQLKSAAAAEGQTQAVSFAEALKQHAQNEEEILYPAALLVGERLRLEQTAK